jgi:endonuclease-8
MPEGDTVFRIATTLRKALLGAQVTIPGVAKSERVTGVEARGKNLLIHFEKRTLRTHLMMHGAWHLYREGEKWQRPAFQARVALHADNGFVAVCFSAPVVEWLRPESLAHLGPDATSDSFDRATAHRRLRSRPPQTSVGDALLDQTAMAGVGNIIKCEALWNCRVDPFAALGDIPDAALASLIDECHRLLLKSRGGAPRALHVYGKARRPCPRCGEPIAVRRTARLTYFCPRCQG